MDCGKVARQAGKQAREFLRPVVGRLRAPQRGETAIVDRYALLSSSRLSTCEWKNSSPAQHDRNAVIDGSSATAVESISRK
jgi:hypothetical protein